MRVQLTTAGVTIYAAVQQLVEDAAVTPDTDWIQTGKHVLVRGMEKLFNPSNYPGKNVSYSITTVSQLNPVRKCCLVQNMYLGVHTHTHARTHTHTHAHLLKVWCIS